MHLLDHSLKTRVLSDSSLADMLLRRDDGSANRDGRPHDALGDGRGKANSGLDPPVARWTCPEPPAATWSGHTLLGEFNPESPVRACTGDCEWPLRSFRDDGLNIRGSDKPRIPYRFRCAV